MALLLTMISACRTIRIPFSEPSLPDYQRQLVGRHYPQANRVLGPHLPVWTQRDGGERYLRYPDPTHGGGAFYLARISDRDVVVELSRWEPRQNALDETFILPGAQTPLVGSAASDEGTGAGLKIAVANFLETLSSGTEVHIHPVESNIWGQRQVLMVELDDQGVRRRAQQFGVEGPLPMHNVSAMRSISVRPTLAAKVDLFGETPMSQTESTTE